MEWDIGKKIALIRASDDARSGLIDDFYEGYEAAFILPNERETFDGFRQCLALNGQSFPFSENPAREVILVAYDTDNGTRLAGANFLASAIGDRIAVALNYIYVEQEARGKGLLRWLIGVVQEAARYFLTREDSVLATVFIEQNDPLKLDDDRYSIDSHHSGIDQIDRLAIWAHLGAQIVDLDYIQPPLSSAQSADRTLVYAALRHNGSTMDGAFLAARLTNFFGISVLKGSILMMGDRILSGISFGKGLTNLGIARPARPSSCLFAKGISRKAPESFCLSRR